MSKSSILGLYGDDYELHANALSVSIGLLIGTFNVTKRHCYRFLLNLTPMQWDDVDNVISLGPIIKLWSHR